MVLPIKIGEVDKKLNTGGKMIKQIIIVSIMITFILFLSYLGIEYLIAQLIENTFSQMGLN